MGPGEDPKLSKLLREWRVPDAPRSLDERVLGSRKPWWSFWLTGSIRIPVPVGVAIAAILVVLVVALLRGRSASEPMPAAPVSLVDFRPVTDVNVRVIRNASN